MWDLRAHAKEDRRKKGEIRERPRGQLVEVGLWAHPTRPHSPHSRHLSSHPSPPTRSMYEKVPYFLSFPLRCSLDGDCDLHLSFAFSTHPPDTPLSPLLHTSFALSLFQAKSTFHIWSTPARISFQLQITLLFFIHIHFTFHKHMFHSLIHSTLTANVLWSHTHPNHTAYTFSDRLNVCGETEVWVVNVSEGKLKSNRTPHISTGVRL